MATKDGKDDLEAVRAVVNALNSFDSADQERIIRWAREKLGLGTMAAPTTSHHAASLPPKPTVVADLTVTSETVRKGRDIKSFIVEKDPKNDKQLAAVVAYYYAFESPENERKNAITAQDIIDACRLAQRIRPKKPIQTLINAAHSGFLDKAEEAGAYRLNAVGENLVAMALPDGAVGRRVTKRPQKKSPRKNVPKRGK